ncbi:hypothetical protein [Saccharopolyspora mangrovi]|uniref:Uncharacterized protein n=1 Tax=Saccharopolyspora mangrovi TaxID=3082379 RepID=A0ABU6AL00_9PSEU|nr:hypothetical protein [Saccharopolyspora sp. S2-29]MEB3372247.1 hypothetical protein [Saccharopolyspora sp. S2-29]
MARVTATGSPAMLPPRLFHSDQPAPAVPCVDITTSRWALRANTDTAPFGPSATAGRLIRSPPWSSQSVQCPPRPAWAALCSLPSLPTANSASAPSGRRTATGSSAICPRRPIHGPHLAPCCGQEDVITSPLRSRTKAAIPPEGSRATTGRPAGSPPMPSQPTQSPPGATCHAVTTSPETDVANANNAPSRPGRIPVPNIVGTTG